MNDLTLRRIDRALRAASRAQNHSFKNFWLEVANKLEQQLV